jgi:hypothetical protein
MRIPDLTPGQGLLIGLLVSATGWTVGYLAWRIPYGFLAYVVSVIGCAVGLVSAIFVLAMVKRITLRRF